VAAALINFIGHTVLSLREPPLYATASRTRQPRPIYAPTPLGVAIVLVAMTSRDTLLTCLVCGALTSVSSEPETEGAVH
jgi:hypothetical protein